MACVRLDQKIRDKEVRAQEDRESGWLPHRRVQGNQERDYPSGERDGLAGRVERLQSAEPERAESPPPAGEDFERVWRDTIRNMTNRGIVKGDSPEEIESKILGWVETRCYSGASLKNCRLWAVEEIRQQVSGVAS